MKSILGLHASYSHNEMDPYKDLLAEVGVHFEFMCLIQLHAMYIQWQKDSVRTHSSSATVGSPEKARRHGVTATQSSGLSLSEDPSISQPFSDPGDTNLCEDEDEGENDDHTEYSEDGDPWAARVRWFTYSTFEDELHNGSVHGSTAILGYIRSSRKALALNLHTIRLDPKGRIYAANQERETMAKEEGATRLYRAIRRCAEECHILIPLPNHNRIEQACNRTEYSGSVRNDRQRINLLALLETEDSDVPQ